MTRWSYTYPFWVIGLQVDDVIIWKGLPCFTEQISITIITLKKDIKKKGTNVDYINVQTEMKNKAIKLKSATFSIALSHLFSNSVGFSCVFLMFWFYLLSYYYLKVCPCLDCSVQKKKGHFSFSFLSLPSLFPFSSSLLCTVERTMGRKRLS